MAADRQRDLLPLPPAFPAEQFALKSRLSRGTARRVRGAQFWKSWANAGIDSLNLLSGGGACPSGKPSMSQRVALDHIVSCYRDLGPPPADLSPAGAFKALCTRVAPYASEDAGPAGYSQELVSWPPLGSVAVKPEQMMGAADLQKIVGPQACLLSSDFDAQIALDASPVKRPYMDPALRDPRVYGVFLSELHRRGMLRWKQTGHPLLGIFLSERRMAGFG